MRTGLLEVRGVSYSFGGRRGRPGVPVLDGLDLDIAEGEVVGLVGDSGSGKSTLARLIVGLLSPDRGSISVAGLDGATVTGRARAERHRAVQIVFQDPYLSLNPTLSVGWSIAEPLRINGISGGDARVVELLEAVGLPPGVARRRPSQLSGGERQRVAIARALALRPRLVVLDEPVSALDPSIGAQVMALLDELRRREGLAYLLISHDIAAVRGAAQRVAVIDAGRIVEDGPAHRVLSEPRSPRARALVAAAQILSPPPWAWPGSTAHA